MVAPEAYALPTDKYQQPTSDIHNNSAPRHLYRCETDKVAKPKKLGFKSNFHRWQCFPQAKLVESTVV